MVTVTGMRSDLARRTSASAVETPSEVTAFWFLRPNSSVADRA